MSVEFLNNGYHVECPNGLRADIPKNKITYFVTRNGDQYHDIVMDNGQIIKADYNDVKLMITDFFKDNLLIPMQMDTVPTQAPIPAITKTPKGKKTNE